MVTLFFFLMHEEVDAFDMAVRNKDYKIEISV
jgi:hypothetical protein